MLNEIIEAAGLGPEFCANLVRVPIDQFREWMDKKRQIPSFVISELSAVLGASEESLRSRKSTLPALGNSLAPAVWFKLRDARLGDADREFVGLVRRLGYSMAQLDEILSVRNSSIWNALAQSVSKNIDRSLPPALQGSEAATRFRSITNLDQGHVGIGEFIRPRLRKHGLVVIESPIPKSSLEGCCFDIGIEGNERPCVFANTFKSTWFRRNEILLHETCHAVFDLANDPVALDFANESDAQTISEERARAFAQECLVPQSVLQHYTNQFGIKWDSLSVEQLADLVANVHVGQRLILKAAYGQGLISGDQRAFYNSHDCSFELKKRSSHALTTAEYLGNLNNEETPKWLARNRTTLVGTRRLRLPVGYVTQVIDATNSGEISIGKAAEMLLMDRYAFLERFAEFVKEQTLV